MNPLIESNPGVMMGKPVVRVTRITVEHILEKLAAGAAIEQILQAHPRLTREAVLAAVEFGAHALRADVIYPCLPHDALLKDDASSRAGLTAAVANPR